MMSLKKMYIMLRSKLLKTKIPDITNLVTTTALNAKINAFKNKIPSTADYATTAVLNAKINEVKSEILNVTKLVTTTALTTVENKILNVSNSLKKNSK